MTTEEAVVTLNNYILTKHEIGNEWHIALTNDIVENSQNLKFGIYQEAKSVYDAMIDSPKRNFKSTHEVAAEDNPLRVVVWQTTSM